MSGTETTNEYTNQERNALSLLQRNRRCVPLYQRQIRHHNTMEKITQDGFAWRILSRPEAIESFYDGKSLFALHDDESESQILTRQDLQDALDWDDVQIGLEIGFIKTSKA